MFNLLSNSVKFTPSGRIRIKIELQKETEELIFKITDTGIGINPENIKKIGEPYFKTSNNNNDYGIGMGISIVKNHVKSLNGEIEINSKIMKGTTVILKFPYNIEKNKLIFEETEKTIMKRLKSKQSINKSFLTNKIDETVNINSNFSRKNQRSLNFPSFNNNYFNRTDSNIKKVDNLYSKLDLNPIDNSHNILSKSYEKLSSTLNLNVYLDNNKILSNSINEIFKNDHLLKDEKNEINKKYILDRNKFDYHYSNNNNPLKDKSIKNNIIKDNLNHLENRSNLGENKKLDLNKSNYTQNLSENLNSNISLVMDFQQTDKSSQIKHELSDVNLEKNLNVKNYAHNFFNFKEISKHDKCINNRFRHQNSNVSEPSPIQNISFFSNSDRYYNFNLRNPRLFFLHYFR